MLRTRGNERQISGDEPAAKFLGGRADRLHLRLAFHLPATFRTDALAVQHLLRRQCAGTGGRQQRRDEDPTFVLGYAGLLDGRRAATHWEFEQDFQRRFPQVQLDINALYVDDQRIITSAGTAAALDCCLYIIRQRFGSLAANQIARRMIVSPHREGGQAQFIAQPVPKNTRDARINCLLDYLQQHIAEPHSLDSLARVVAMSRRTLTRHFARATGMSITDWLTAERLRRSQTLLEAGDLPVEQVAEAVGYLSAVTWRQQFKARFGVSPTEWRRTFRRGA